jgi:hypothetical protein
MDTFSVKALCQTLCQSWYNRVLIIQSTTTLTKWLLSGCKTLLPQCSAVALKLMVQIHALFCWCWWQPFCLTWDAFFSISAKKLVGRRHTYPIHLASWHIGPCHLQICRNLAILPSENPRIVKCLTREKSIPHLSLVATCRSAHLWLVGYWLLSREVFYDSRILRWQNRCSTPTFEDAVFLGIPKQNDNVAVGSVLNWRARSRRHSVNWAEDLVDEHHKKTPRQD